MAKAFSSTIRLPAFGDLLASKGASVSQFVRLEVGEGIEKKQENFADEVAAQAAAVAAGN